jgi:hypothetical protein
VAVEAPTRETVARMDGSDLSPAGVLALTGYGLAGLVGALVAGVVLLVALQPAQPIVYDALYRRLGPWTATSAATAVQFGAAGALAVVAPTVVAAYVDGDSPLSVARVLAAIVAVVVVVLTVAVAAGLPALAAVAVTHAAFVAVGVVVVGRVDASLASRGAFVGGATTLALLLVVLSFGLGWGGGYDVVAEPAPDATDVAANFADAPALRDDLFAADTCDDGDDGVCRLSLRTYDHEAAAGRFLDDNGVRCPFVNQPATSDRSGSFVATYDGDHYRVTCEAYGD